MRKVGALAALSARPRKRVAVIGAGMVGLAAAIRLAAMGFEVDVFEKNAGVGGRVGRLEAEGFSFDTGPSLLLMSDTYRELFRFAGRDLDDYVGLIPLDANYRVTFGDGNSLTIRRTLPELIKELESIEPGVTPSFYRFLEDACNKYRLGRAEFVERDFEGARDFFGLRNLRLLLRTRALGNYYRQVSKFFASEKLRQAFSLQTMYLGLSPLEAPAVYSLLPYTELAEDGLWFPQGGMYSLIEAIFRDRRLPDDPSFYAAIPSRTEPNMAPEGMESLFVLVPVPHLRNANVNWERDGSAFKQKIYNLLEKRCGVRRGWIVFDKARTPVDWRADYNLEEGADFGIGHGILQVGYFRPPMVSKSIEGLYFVGASTRPGTGVPLVTIGARLVADRIGREVHT